MAPGADKPVLNRSHLQRVLGSEAFRHSESLRHLLAYLGEKSLADPPEELKEYTIGVDACGKPPSYDPQKDASVRVQVGRLRQKLEEYYRAEGEADPVVLELPKGRFAILFHERQAQAGLAAASVAQPAPRMMRLAGPAVLVLAVALAGALIWSGLLARRVRDLESRAGAGGAAAQRAAWPLWTPFLTSNVPTTVVFGSPPFFASSKYPLLVRLFDSRNPDEPRSSPEFGTVDAKVGPLAGPRFDYASMGDAIAVQRLTVFFGSAGLALRAMPAHLAVWDSIKDGNIVFLGALRMHPLLRRLPVSLDFELGADDQIHNRRPQPGEQQVYTTPSHRNVMTYAVVGAYPGLKPGCEVLVITAHSSPGAIAAADFITTPGSLKILHDRVGMAANGPRKYFQALLRIHVDNDVPVKAEYVTHHVNP